MSKILVLYHSQEHGNTGAMADAVAEGAREAGAEVTLVNTNEQRMHIDAYRGMKGVAVGSPDYYSYIAGGLKMFLDDWYIANKENSEGMKDKPLALFYSHGGGGAVKGRLEELFARLGNQVGITVESSGAPDDNTLDRCRELGAQLADAASY